MKKYLFFLVFFSVQLHAQNYVPTLYELKGFEDFSGNTHLFYRDYSYSYSSTTENISNSIYWLNTSNENDIQFLADYFFTNPMFTQGVYQNSYYFWNNNPTTFIHNYDYFRDCGIPPLTLIGRYDTSDIIIEFNSIRAPLLVSKQNPNKVLLTVEGAFVQSLDGGLSWDILILYPEAVFKAISPANDNHLYGIDNAGNIVKSITGGTDPFIVYEKNSVLFNNITVSSNGKNVYATGVTPFSNYNFFEDNYYLLISNNFGNPFSFSIRVNSKTPIYIALDDSNSELIYYASQNKIYKSTNGGQTFELIKTLDFSVTGFYKKSGEDVFYVSTPTRIVKIELDNVTEIKESSKKLFYYDFYPLKVGYKWVYSAVDAPDDFPPVPPTYFNIIKTIVGESSINGKKYFKIEELNTMYNHTITLHERLDSNSGFIYRLLPDSTGEEVIEKLFATVGEIIEINPHGYDALMNLVSSINLYTFFGQATYQRYNSVESLYLREYSLLKEFGIGRMIFGYDFGYTEYSLKGMIKDGTIYGDTTLISVKENENTTPNQFILYQNYPNPFNPTTKISYQIPYAGKVELKVYDILGKEVATLVNEDKDVGRYSVEFDGNKFASGIYVYRISAGKFTDTKKFILLK